MARSDRLAVGLGAMAVAEVVFAVAIALRVGWSWQDAFDAFVVTNSAMGVAFAVCGMIIARHHPGNPIGWLFLADGLGHATSAAAIPIATMVADLGGPVGLQRLLVTVFLYAWPWSIALFLPVALLLFPTGRAPSRRWRAVVIAVIATAPLFVVEMAADPAPLAVGPGVSGYLTIPAHSALQPLWTVAELRTVGALLLAVVALALRYRGGAEVLRRQLLWLLLAGIVAVAGTVAWSFLAGTPVVVLFAIPLIPVAVTVAIVRHQLLDIRLVVSRTLAWLLLSAGVVAAYVVLVAVLDRFVSAQVGRSAVATVIIALLVAPVLPRLQRLVDRAMYGERADPSRMVSRVGTQLVTDPDSGLGSVVAAVRTALRLPYLAVATDGTVLAADGLLGDAEPRSIPLVYGDQTVGELRVGLRSRERELDPADRHALTLVAAPLAVALHATRLSAQLHNSRRQIITAREEERRRLRRDLHDGLGPALTGIAFTADAASNLIESDTAKARDLLTALRADSRTAIADVRRLVDDLRPPALDEFGLPGALRHRAEQLAWHPDGTAIEVSLDMPERLPPLPAGVEVAAYRIATEALTNIARHSHASAATLRLRCGDRLDVDITDNGPANGDWTPGVGLHAMRERATELGGRFQAGPTDTGGRVSVSLPLGAP